MWHWERITAGPNKGAWMHPCFIRGNKVLCSYMSRHCSVQKPNVPLHWMCPSKLLPSAEKIDSNRLGNMITRGMGDLATEAFHLDDITLPKVQQNTFGDQIESKIPTDGICKNISAWFPTKGEIVTGNDHKCFEDKIVNIQSGYNVPDSILEPTPIREDLLSNRDNISFLSDHFLWGESDVFREDVRSCVNINLLLEPLSDETIDDFF